MCTHSASLSLFALCACMYVCVCICVCARQLDSKPKSQSAKSATHGKSGRRQEATCLQRKQNFSFNFYWVAGPREVKPRSHPQAPHAHQGHPPVMLRVVRASRQTTSINIVLCAKKQPKLRHLSVLKVERVCSLIRLFVRSFAPQIEK